jgi:hypothetical protein
MAAFDGYHVEEDPLGATATEHRQQKGDEGGPRSARGIARALGRSLTPVVIDLDAGQPRFGSYLEWDEQHGTPLLVPVAGEALSLALANTRALIRIRSTDPAQPWMLVARAIRVATHRMAIVELARMDAIRMAERVPGRTQARSASISIVGIPTWLP